MKPTVQTKAAEKNPSSNIAEINASIAVLFLPQFRKLLFPSPCRGVDLVLPCRLATMRPLAALTDERKRSSAILGFPGRHEVARGAPRVTGATFKGRFSHARSL